MSVLTSAHAANMMRSTPGERRATNLLKEAAMAHAASWPLALDIAIGLFDLLPMWCVITMIGVAAALATMQVTVTQIVRLRASRVVTRSGDGVAVLKIEDGRRNRRCRDRSANGESDVRPRRSSVR